ncbi:MAG: hypothetical protein V3V70_04620 [Candidatus Scalindua sp.]
MRVPEGFTSLPLLRYFLFFPNSLSYIASLKTIEILERENVLEKIWEKGERFFKRLEKVIENSNVGAELSGIAPMFFITFKKDAHKTYKEKRKSFYTQLIRRGIFMQPYHHGYIAYRHTEDDLDKAVIAIEDAISCIQYIS